jgi:tetratricopeptide (TPR) repeat protein
VAIKGSLREASLAEVCQLLALGLKTGCLSVADRSRFGQVYFDHGRITFARIVNRRDRLGDLLIGDGALTQEQLDAVLEVQGRSPERRLGEILREQGLIGEEQLNHYMFLQIEEAVCHLFTWSRGHFYFEAGERPDAGEITVSINAESLLLEAARRVDEWSLIRKRIPSLELVFEVDGQRLFGSDAQLADDQRRIAELLDGERSVQDIMDATGLGEFEVGKALFGLLQAGFARKVGRQPEGPDRPRESDIKERHNLGVAFFRTGMLEDAAREFRRVLEIAPDDMRARFHLAMISMRQGEHRDAARELVQIARRHGPNYAVLVNLATAFRHMDRTEDALLALNEAENARARTPAVALARAVTYLHQQELDQTRAALQDYRSRLDPGEKPEAAWYYHAALTEAIGSDASRAQALCWEGLEVHPDVAPLLLLAGLAAERLGDNDGAELFYRRAIEVEPNLPQAHKDLGDIAYARGATDEATRLYQRASELAPDLGDDVYAKLGALHYRARNREAAVRCWTRSLELNPANDAVRNRLEVLRHAGA